MFLLTENGSLKHIQRGRVLSDTLQCTPCVRATGTLCTSNSAMCQCAEDESLPNILEVNYTLLVRSDHLCSAELRTLKTPVGCSIDQN